MFKKKKKGGRGRRIKGKEGRNGSRTEGKVWSNSELSRVQFLGLSVCESSCFDETDEMS